MSRSVDCDYCRVAAFLIFRVTVLVAVFLPTFSCAFPNGAGGCNSGPAVGGEHLTGQIITGSLEEGKFQIEVNDIVYIPGQTLGIQAGEVSSIRISGMDDSGAFLRGFLLRLETNEIDALQPLDDDDETQSAS